MDTRACGRCGAALTTPFCGTCGAPAAASFPPPPGVGPPPFPGPPLAPPSGPAPSPRKTGISPLFLLVTLIVAGLAGVGVVLLVSGGGSGGGSSDTGTHTYEYPAAVKSNFLTACESSGGTGGKCECALGNLEDNVSLARLAEMESQIRATGKVPSELLDALDGC